MQLRVIGCNGGVSRHHRLATYLVDGRVALDAGSLCSGLTLEEQDAVGAACITHAHIDHIGELAHLVELRSQRGGQLVVAGRAETIEALRAHYFNDVIWPDFEALKLPGGPALAFRILELDADVQVEHLTIRPVEVDHTIPACGYIVSDGRRSLGYTGDTGPTERFWDEAASRPDLQMVITEVSFPNHMAKLAELARHLTPESLRDEVAKLRQRSGRTIPVYLSHLKSAYEAQLRQEIDALDLRDVRVLELGETLTV